MTNHTSTSSKTCGTSETYYERTGVCKPLSSAPETRRDENKWGKTVFKQTYPLEDNRGLREYDRGFLVTLPPSAQVRMYNKAFLLHSLPSVQP